MGRACSKMTTEVGKRSGPSFAVRSDSFPWTIPWRIDRSFAKRASNETGSPRRTWSNIAVPTIARVNTLPHSFARDAWKPAAKRASHVGRLCLPLPGSGDSMFSVRGGSGWSNITLRRLGTRRMTRLINRL
jgi:hypothetical protein